MATPFSQVFHHALHNCGITGNGLSGIMLTNFARTTITNCTISENEMDGIVLADTVQARITGNRIVGNGKFGIGLYRKDCDYEYAPREFTGHISGSGNSILGATSRAGVTGWPSVQLSWLSLAEWVLEGMNVTGT
ncbi:MAG: right-handed parallel beta-helix repeat-containing protein [Candidatus Bipolaricaulota bacterium]|nr:right-handed parallel beta-helix repeat-containing protein [Candidatus Bipolaricaulota bacterium]